MLHKKIGIIFLTAALFMTLTACSYRSVQTALEELSSFGDTASDSAPHEAENGSHSIRTEPPVSAEPVVSAETTRQSAAMLSLFRMEDRNWSWQNETASCCASWEYLYLSEEDAAAYPALASRLEAMNQEAENAGVRWMADQESLLGGSGNQPGTYTQYDAVQRADETVLSVLHQIDFDTGNFSAGTTVWTTNLDPATGKELHLADVFVDPDALPALLEKQCNVEGQVPGGSVGAYLKNAIAQDKFLWTVGFQNVRFVFPFESTEGQISASLWFRESPELFREKFRYPAEQYAVRLMPGMPLEIDLDSRDQRRDTVSVTALRDEFGVYMQLDLSVNGVTKTLLPDGEIGGCQVAALYLVDLADGQQVLYLDTEIENAYRILSVYRLSDMQLLERYWGIGLDEKFDGEGTQTALLTDPAAFRLCKRHELLGTMWASCEFQVEPSSGLPIAKKSYFDLSMPRTLTTKRSVGATALPEQTGESIAAGTLLTLLRTDCLSYVDVQTPDGREYRIAVEASQWPITVNGKPIEECFDGILFTG